MSLGIRANLIAAAPALALYAVACATPAITFWNTQNQTLDTFSGGKALIVGPLAMLAGQFSWLANPVFAVAVTTLLLGQPRTSVLLSAIAGALVTHTFALKGHPLPANEGGEGELQLRELGPGFYLWGASMIALAGGAVIRSITKHV